MTQHSFGETPVKTQGEFPRGLAGVFGGGAPTMNGVCDAVPTLPPLFREQLLPTEPDALDPSAARAIRAFCADAPEIGAAYVCSVERTRDGEKPTRVLRLSVKLVTPVDGPDDGRAQQFSLFERFAQAHPDLARRFGFGVLSDRGVPAFERYGLTIYRR